MADFLSKITLPNQSSYPIRASAIPYGEVDSTSTSVTFTATVPGIYALEDGVTVLLKNEVIDSTSQLTVNINNLGAKPIYNSDQIGKTDIVFNIDSTMLLIYNSTLVSGGCWICYKGYDMPPKMTILAYGSSTWDDFIAAYNSNTIVYCRASSNSNPATGNQTRMAFMAYVNSNPPTEVEFQYYRSVSSHSATQQGDQVYIYKLNKNTGWSVTAREAMSKIAAGAGLASTYKNGTITLSATNTPDLSNYVQKTDYASASTAGVVKVDGTSITINNGVISASTYASIENIVDGDSTGSIRQIRAIQPNSTYSMGTDAFAEGYQTKASGSNSHAEGSNTNARASCSHTEGFFTTAAGSYSHAEGQSSIAYGESSHVEGDHTTTYGKYSHAEGYQTIADDGSHVQGKFNIRDTTGTYAHIVGNGTDSNNRSNAYTLDWSGNGIFAGKVTAGSTASNPMDLVTLSQLQAAIPNALPYFHTTLNTPASTFTIAHYLDTTNIQVSVIGMESASTYMVPMSPFATDLAYMVDVVDEDTVTLKFSKNLNGTYYVNILGMDTKMFAESGDFLLISQE